MTESETVHKLNNKWKLWFHDPLDNNWKLDSYKGVYTIDSIESYWKLYSFLNNKIVENSMFFLMRQNIEPLWEHTENINGGSWSLKMQKGDLYKTWSNISISLLNESISKEASININGISISPKKNFCIIKIWTNKNINNIKNLNAIKNLSYDGIIFKPHSI